MLFLPKQGRFLACPLARCLLLCGAGAQTTRATRRKSTRSLAADNICNNISINNNNTKTYNIIDIHNNIKSILAAILQMLDRKAMVMNNVNQTAETGRSALINVDLLDLSNQH